MTRKDLMNKYAEVLAEIEKANPIKETDANGNITGEHAPDMGVCLDMLIADAKVEEGATIPYPFDGMKDFDFGAFTEDYEKYIG